MSKKSAPADPSANMKRTNYFMPEPMRDGLNLLADKKGGTAAEHVRRAVGQYLKRHRIST
jgi:predicted DNA-binding protein